MKAYYFILFFTTVKSDITTPSSLLGPRNFNHHAYEAKLSTDPTRQGPVLFPKSTAPPPRTPLIVTSRPLAESIAKSDYNNTEAQSSNINRVTYSPDYSDCHGYHPYADVKKTRLSSLERDNIYNDYEERTVLPPIYKALSDYANQRVGHTKKQKRYQVREPDYENRYNDVNDYGRSDYNQGENYAFSYAVKDQKTGDDFSHKQRSTGSATNGEYRVRLPDGRMQIVSYTADENGYKADVRYDNDNGYNNQYHNDNEYHNQNDNRHNNAYKTDYNTPDLHPRNEYKQPNDYYDLSKEYNDYSLEYDGKFEKFSPHKPKFSTYGAKNNNLASKNFKSSVKPSYEELKYLFVTRKPLIPLQQTNNDVVSSNNIPVEINVPSTTSNTLDFDASTQPVVYITKKPLYTDVRHNIPNTTPSYLTNNRLSSNVVATPNYLNNLIPNKVIATPTANIYNVNLSGAKPILSDSFLSRINKYLKFK